jgi:hypothetical protein
VSSFKVILLAVDKSKQSDKTVVVARDLAKVSGGLVVYRGQSSPADADNVIG